MFLKKGIFGFCIFIILCEFTALNAASKRKEGPSRRSSGISPKIRAKGTEVTSESEPTIQNPSLETRIHDFNSKLIQDYHHSVRNINPQFWIATLNINLLNVLQNSIDSLKNVKEKQLQIILYTNPTVTEALEIQMSGRSTNEWFTYLSNEMTNVRQNCLFRFRNRTIELKGNVNFNTQSLEMYKFYGKITGLALFNQKLLNVCFTIKFLKSILQWNKSDAGVKSQLDMFMFMLGFNEIIPQNLITTFDAIELQEILCGNEITVKDARLWHNYVEYVKCDENLPQAKYFWRYVELSNISQLVRLIQFITGSPRLPQGGFKNIRFKIQEETDKNKNYCSPGVDLRTLHLPKCGSFEEFKTQLKNGMTKIENRFYI